MKNTIRTGDKIWLRRSKKLVSGEIQCPRCGDWTKVRKLSDKHFTEEYICTDCKKETKEESPPPKQKKATGLLKQKKFKPYFPPNCPHRPMYRCKRPSECVGCYWNPEKKVALMAKSEDDEPKKLWFYSNKKDAKEQLKLLDDIKNGVGLFPNGNRCKFKNARTKDDMDDQEDQ